MAVAHPILGRAATRWALFWDIRHWWVCTHSRWLSNKERMCFIHLGNKCRMLANRKSWPWTYGYSLGQMCLRHRYANRSPVLLTPHHKLDPVYTDGGSWTINDSICTCGLCFFWYNFRHNGTHLGCPTGKAGGITVWPSLKRKGGAGCCPVPSA